MRVSIGTGDSQYSSSRLTPALVLGSQNMVTHCTAPSGRSMWAIAERGPGRNAGLVAVGSEVGGVFSTCVLG